MNLTDNLNSVPAVTALRTAFTCIDRIQDEHPAEQVAGAAVLFVALCRRFSVDPRIAMLGASERITDALNDMKANRAPNEYVRAITSYLNTEIK